MTSLECILKYRFLNKYFSGIDKEISWFYLILVNRKHVLFLKNTTGFQLH